MIEAGKRPSHQIAELLVDSEDAETAAERLLQGDLSYAIILNSYPNSTCSACGRMNRPHESCCKKRDGRDVIGLGLSLNDELDAGAFL